MNNHTVSHITIRAEDEGQRIDNFLFKHLKGVPKSWVYRVLRRGEVRVNSKRVKPTYRLASDDVLRLPPIRVSPKVPTVLNSRLAALLEDAVVHEDNDLLILNKPAKIAVHSGTGIKSSVIETLRVARNDPNLELVHRLDKETSGLLLLAKSRLTLTKLQEALRLGKVTKTYHALLANRWVGGVKSIDTHLAQDRDSSGERKIRVSEAGKAAKTVITPIENLPHACFVEIALMTGRTHQIRVHTSHIGHPIIGDSKYGDKDAMPVKSPTRLFLQASELRFLHPITNKPLTIRIPIDDDFTKLIQQLR